MTRISILIADDQQLFAESLSTLICTYAKDMTVLGIATNGAEAIEMGRSLHPDIVLMDIRMPDINGVRATKEIKLHLPDVKVLILSTFDEDEYISGALRAGASGYLLKDIGPRELIASIRATKGGTMQISPTIASRLVEQFEAQEGNSTPHVPGYEELTKREKEVFALLRNGYGNAEIARRLFLAEQTVRNYVSLIYDKIGIHDRSRITQVGKQPD